MVFPVPTLPETHTTFFILSVIAIQYKNLYNLIKHVIIMIPKDITEVNRRLIGLYESLDSYYHQKNEGGLILRAYFTDSHSSIRRSVFLDETKGIKELLTNKNNCEKDLIMELKNQYTEIILRYSLRERKFNAKIKRGKEEYKELGTNIDAEEVKEKIINR